MIITSSNIILFLTNFATYFAVAKIRDISRKKYAAKVQRLQFARGPLMPSSSSSSSPSMSMSGSFTPEFFRLERHRSRLRRRVGCSFGAIRNLQRLHQTLVHFCFLGPLCQKVFFSLSFAFCFCLTGAEMDSFFRARPN